MDLFCFDLVCRGVQSLGGCSKFGCKMISIVRKGRVCSYRSPSKPGACATLIGAHFFFRGGGVEGGGVEGRCAQSAAVLRKTCF